MGTLTQEGKKALAGGGITTLYASLHTSAPGAGGANEVAGAPYARQAVNFDAPADGAGTAVVISANDLPTEIDVPGGVSVDNFGFWSALTGGIFYGVDPLASAETSANDFAVRLNTAVLNVTD